MIPSAVAHEVARALRDFLATGFGTSNPPLAHVLDDFLAEQENLVKGPYLSIALPPKLAPEGGEPFPEVPLGFTPYRHQRIAHQRLDSGAAHGGRSTIVATGTGSGKTECFLWPIAQARDRVPTAAGALRAVPELPAETAKALLLGILRRMKDRGAFRTPLTAM